MNTEAPGIDWEAINKQEHDAISKATASDNSLKQLFNDFSKADAAFNEASNKSKQLEAERAALEEKILDYFDSMGIDSISIDGSKFSLLEMRFASPKEEARTELFTFLREEGYEDRIKQSQETVHPRTLASIFKEMEDQGIELPAHKMTVRRKIKVKSKLNNQHKQSTKRN